MLQTMLHYGMNILLNSLKIRKLQGLCYTTENLCVSSFYTLHNSHNSLIYNDLQGFEIFSKSSNLCYNLCYNSFLTGKFSLQNIFIKVCYVTIYVTMLQLADLSNTNKKG